MTDMTATSRTSPGLRTFTAAELMARPPEPLPRCSQCKREAESFHSFYGKHPAQLACDRHDPEGYWVYLYDTPKARKRSTGALQRGLEHWLRHLADSHPSVASDLLTWLATPDGLIALRKMATYRSLSPTPQPPATDPTKRQP
jgi:hypothetical protein